MYRYHHYHRNIRPWHGSIHSGIWLIGLAVLFLTGLWWPGILVLVGISMVLQWAFSQGSSPQVFEPAKAPTPRPMSQPAAPAPVSPVGFSQVVQPAPFHPLQLLPSACSHCGGPVRAYEVKWTGAQTAVCAYCGSVLPLKKG